MVEPLSSETRLCLTCKQPTSMHIGFQCPDQCPHCQEWVRPGDLLASGYCSSRCYNDATQVQI
jgi:hypothetical protein